MIPQAKNLRNISFHIFYSSVDSKTLLKNLVCSGLDIIHSMWVISIHFIWSTQIFAQLKFFYCLFSVDYIVLIVCYLEYCVRTLNLYTTAVKFLCTFRQKWQYWFNKCGIHVVHLGFQRQCAQFPIYTRGSCAQNFANGQTAQLGSSSSAIETCSIRVAMGRSLCKWFPVSHPFP